MDQGFGLAGRRVLLVEDEWIIASDLTRLLQAAGADVIGPAATVATAVTLLTGRHGVDAAILDVQLKDGPAYEVADLLEDRRIPYVFVSGHAHDFVAEPYRHAPFCEKPLEIKALVAAFQTWSPRSAD